MEVQKIELKNILRFRAVDTVSGSVLGTLDVVSVTPGVAMIAPEEYDSPRWGDVSVNVKRMLIEPAMKALQDIYTEDLKGSYNPAEDHEYLL